jgi:signal transduction histidine kinase
VNLPRLLRTTAVRLVLRYVLLYALVLGLALTAMLWSANRHVDSQLEEDLEQELAALDRAYQEGNSGRLTETLAGRLEWAVAEGRIYLLVGADGEKLEGNLYDWPPDASIAFDGKVHSVRFDDSVIPVELYDDDAWWPVIAREFADGSRLLLGRLVQQDEALHEITEYLLAVMSVAVLLALAMGITLGRSILGRVDTISRAAGDIMAGDLSRRVTASGRNDEFDALASRLNSMLDRIQQLIKGIREVTDNVAHDLRSPLSRMRNRLEVTLLEPRSESEYRQAISRTIEETESLLATFNAILGIAQMEAGQSRTQRGPVDLNRLAADLMELYEPVAQKMGQRLRLVTGEDVVITGSRNLLAQAVGNLLDNAIKYTPTGGSIELQVKPSRDVVEVIVADSGPGIRDAERAHVLERFVRLEHSRHTPGNGLGLSLVKAVAGLHGASLVLGDNRPGLIVTLRLPRDRRNSPAGGSGASDTPLR